MKMKTTLWAIWFLEYKEKKGTIHSKRMPAWMCFEINTMCGNFLYLQRSISGIPRSQKRNAFVEYAS